jgi:NAD(P) transhydrogenase subunit alpha
MKIASVKESLKDERRTALMPEAVAKLVSSGCEIGVESGSGMFAGASDEAYTEAGARVGSREDTLKGAHVVTSINRPPDDVLAGLDRGSVVVSQLRCLDEPRALKPFLDHGLTAVALEMIPRTTRAQAMDVLSSMATIAGYRAVLFAASRLPKIFPLLTTAAGTIPPAKVLVLGAGVAGLQAIATARRLGAVVEGFDIRAAAGEAVRSLGAKFIEIPEVDAEGEGGYAKEVTEEVLEQSRKLIEEHAALNDCIITTALVPGRPAPRLITEDAVKAMAHGSVIVDLAAPNGGNCELTEPDKVIERHGVTITGPTNAASGSPVHASMLFSKNVFNFMNLIAKEGNLNVDLDDDIVAGSCIIYNGEFRNPRVEALYNEAAG